ncbi:MAG: hypothetical protein V1908_03815 [Candidatus Peregrinibacteria bacterium]
MKPDIEPRRKGLIIGSALVAALAAWLAVKGEREVPVVSKTRDQAGHVIDGDVQRAAMVAAGRAKLKEAGTFSPPEPLTVDSALRLAREGNFEAAQWLVGKLRAKRARLLESGAGADINDPEFRANATAEAIEQALEESRMHNPEEEWESASKKIANQEGVSLEEWATFEAAIDIVRSMEELIDFSEDIGANLNVDVQYKTILQALINVGELGAHNPLLTRLLGLSEEGLKDLMEEAIVQNPLIPESERLSDENIASLRAWYGLVEVQ